MLLKLLISNNNDSDNINDNTSFSLNNFSIPSISECAFSGCCSLQHIDYQIILKN